MININFSQGHFLIETILSMKIGHFRDFCMAMIVLFSVIDILSTLENITLCRPSFFWYKIVSSCIKSFLMMIEYDLAKKVDILSIYIVTWLYVMTKWAKVLSKPTFQLSLHHEWNFIYQFFLRPKFAFLLLKLLIEGVVF